MSTHGQHHFCLLWIHDDNFSEETVVFNSDRVALNEGSLCKLAALKNTVSTHDFTISTPALSATRPENTPGKTSLRNGGRKSVKYASDMEKHADSSRSLIFMARDMTPEQKRKQPRLQVSVHTNAAAAFGFRNNMQAIVLPALEDVHSASHVEIVFRDQYLARSDMWRLTVAVLSEKSVFKGQKLLFLGSIKATVKNIFVDGQKVTSAFFSSSTKPIFRSESAKYVVFIQMSREMWDFDAEGSGEIMFNKVINGFLPDLFKRWQKLNVHHLVSIIMFTRLEYEHGVLVRRDEDTDASHSNGRSPGNGREYRDYYRVVTTDASSSRWVDILYKLKKEFKVFLKDVSVVGGNDAYGPPPETLASVKARTETESVIAGQPTTSARGNILEAINLAASQFSKDYIDRDLVHTGISLCIVTAGTGIFEVDYNILKLTTDALVASGMGVDLVSLARMPLHSVPLFRYRSPHILPGLPVVSDIYTFEGGSTPRQAGYLESFMVGTPRGTGRFMRRASSHNKEQVPGTLMESGVQWSYALPHWIDVSFWTGHSDEEHLRTQYGLNYKRKKGSKRNDSFTTSCRMYELQMMGLMETEMSDIAIPLMLSEYANAEKPRQARHHLEPAPSEELSGSYGSTRSFHGYIASSPQQHDDDSRTKMDMSTRKEIIDWMAAYDKQVPFRTQDSPPVKTILDQTPIESSRGSLETTVRFSSSPTKSRNSLATQQFRPGESPRGTGFLGNRSPPKRAMLPVKTDQPKQSSMRSTQTVPRRAPMPRQLSLVGGLGTAKSTASTSVSNESAGTSTPTLESPPPPTAPKSGGLFSSLTQQLLSTLQRKPSQASLRTTASGFSDRVDSDRASMVQRSTPIAIRSNSVVSEHEEEQEEEGEESQKAETYRGSVARMPEDIVIRDASVVGRQAATMSDSAPDASADRADYNRVLSPLTAISPWLTMLNPSNPKKHNMSIASQFRRWQHIFPKPVPTSVMKWKSLCSPASLPLTAEYFPTAEQLRNEYSESPYRILPLDDDESSEAPKTREALIRELIACRLSHGFQIVVGPAATEFAGTKAASLVKVFDKNYMAEDGATVLMTVGNNIHLLVCTENGEIEVRRYNRKPVAEVEYTGAVNPTVAYHPYIRTYLAKGYEMRPVIFKNPRPTYNWNAIDHHLAGYKQEHTSQDMRFWRARFVLIPVAHKIRSGQLGFVSENSEEEIRLEGIQKLTQIWQRHRYIPPEERRFQQSLQQRRKDPNPLAIEYHTHDPSMIVRNHATGLAEALSQDEPGHDLFAESEQYHTNDFDMQKLAQHLQASPPKGIPVADRRWHFKTHWKCFRGDHLTSFLLVNFKDIETREDAVKLGNALMKKGLFTHAVQKHQFRDGNYFYQVAPDYRTMPYPENKSGWFGMAGRSIPTTPMQEGSKASPKFLPVDKIRSPKVGPVDKARSPLIGPSDSNRPRSGTDETKDSGRSTPKPDSNKRPRLELSRSLRYDVDHRKNSYRPEIITLHYDRIHNPENCYHIRLEWINVTAKLIEDALVSWATSVERYGLKLVELPIAEGYDTLTQHPFRRPYLIKLALQPPRGTPKQYLEAGTTAYEETYPFQRALVRKFDFVLDYEAASTFDQGVDVSYSWGKPDYQYTQFIHKSGGLLIQIDGDGNLMLAANRLCVNRSATAREASKYEVSRREKRNFSTPAPPAHASPFLGALKSSEPQSVLSRNSFTEASVEPENVAQQLEAFCFDAEKLRIFYEDALRPTASPSPHLTPRQTPRQTPVLSAMNAIPHLGLPPSISLRNASFAESSPRIGLSPSRRSSIQGLKSYLSESGSHRDLN
ncbi:hypothetical protein E4T39_04089 [Aureobasidium subglaciale]|nr:hypothetical protein E4T39_04089 [Aureobasidium subglaciale]